MLPLQPIRAILAQNSPFHISDEAITTLRDTLEDIIRQVGHESLREFESLNRNRERHGLRALKRLNSWSIERAVQKIINEETISYMDSESIRTTEIRGPGDTIDENMCIIRPNATDDSREVV